MRMIVILIILLLSLSPQGTTSEMEAYWGELAIEGMEAQIEICKMHEELILKTRIPSNISPKERINKIEKGLTKGRAVKDIYPASGNLSDNILEKYNEIKRKVGYDPTLPVMRFTESHLPQK